MSEHEEPTLDEIAEMWDELTDEQRYAADAVSEAVADVATEMERSGEISPADIYEWRREDGIEAIGGPPISADEEINSVLVDMADDRDARYELTQRLVSDSDLAKDDQLRLAWIAAVAEHHENSEAGTNKRTAFEAFLRRAVKE